MSQDERNRYEGGDFRDKKQCQNCIAQDILESWSPTIGKHLFENRHKSPSNNGPQFWTRIVEHIESYWVFLVGWVKKNDIVGTRFWDIGEYRISKISMWINESNPTSCEDIRVEHIFEKGRFSHTRFSDDVYVSGTVDGLDTKTLLASAKIGNPNRCIGRIDWR